MEEASFRAYFDVVDNFEWFHRVIQRMLEAPTVEITRMLQSKIIAELRLRGELRAAAWFEDTWTGEHGNYTNTTAGYVGNNKSSGLESHWRYMRRDTIGSAGSNLRVALSVFIPSLKKYVADLSEKHACKVLNQTTDKHMFQSLPSISTKMWNLVQKFDVSLLMLSRIEGGEAVAEQWSRALKFFEQAVFESVASRDDMQEPASITELIRDFYARGNKVGIARSSIIGLLMPDAQLVSHLRRKYKLEAHSLRNIEELRGYLDPIFTLFQDLFHRTGEWDAEYHDKDVEDTLVIMESFVRLNFENSLSLLHPRLTLLIGRVMPLPVKHGELLFKSTTRECFSSFVSVESVVMSMVFNRDLTVPDTLSAVQLK